MVKKLPKGKNLRGAAAKKYIMELETFLLCQLLIKLPKKAAIMPENNQQPFTFESNGMTKLEVNVSKDFLTCNYV